MMQKLMIDHKPYAVEKCTDMGDIMSVRNAFQIPEDNLYLLTGESLQASAYYPVVQVFAVLKKQGFDFVLCMAIPMMLRDAILKCAEQAGISDNVCMTEEGQEMSGLPYKERICVPVGLNNCLILSNKGIMIDADFSSIVEKCFGERKRG